MQYAFDSSVAWVPRLLGFLKGDFVFLLSAEKSKLILKIWGARDAPNPHTCLIYQCIITCYNIQKRVLIYCKKERSDRILNLSIISTPIPELKTCSLPVLNSQYNSLLIPADFIYAMSVIYFSLLLYLFSLLEENTRNAFESFTIKKSSIFLIEKLHL